MEARIANRHKLLVILISLLFHLGFLFVLFISVQQHLEQRKREQQKLIKDLSDPKKKNWKKMDTAQPAPVIFEEYTPPKQEFAQSDNAQALPEMQEQPELEQTERVQTEQAVPESTTSQEPEQTHEREPEKKQPADRTKTVTEHAPIPVKEFDKPDHVFSVERQQPVQQAQPQKKSLTLAQIAHGFVRQQPPQAPTTALAMHGQRTGKITAAQMMYSNFARKILDALIVAYQAHQSHMPQSEQTQKAHIFLTLDRAGKISRLQVARSSGSTFIDQYALSLFTYASSSFPEAPKGLEGAMFNFEFTFLDIREFSSAYGWALH